MRFSCRLNVIFMEILVRPTLSLNIHCYIGGSCVNVGICRRELVRRSERILDRTKTISLPLPRTSDLLQKLLLIGDSGVGKSCLLLRFADDSMGLFSLERESETRGALPLSDPFHSLSSV